MKSTLLDLILGHVCPMDIAIAICDAEDECNMLLSDDDVIALMPITKAWLSPVDGVNNGSGATTNSEHILKLVAEERMKRLS